MKYKLKKNTRANRYLSYQNKYKISQSKETSGVSHTHTHTQKEGESKQRAPHTISRSHHRQPAATSSRVVISST